jgi:hypothetical protein
MIQEASDLKKKSQSFFFFELEGLSLQANV